MTLSTFKGPQGAELKVELKIVGRVKDAHGLKGELFIRLPAGRADWLEDLNEIILQKDQDLKTFTLEDKWPHKDGIVVKPQGISDRTAAEGLKGYELAIPLSMLQAESGETPYLNELLGFTVEDKVLGVIGQVQGFSSNGAQDLLEIGKNLVPFIKEFVTEVDYQKRVIFTHLPEGLIE